LLNWKSVDVGQVLSVTKRTGKMNTTTQSSVARPWFSLENHQPIAAWQSKTAVVVGGGLAGATVAYRLAQMGWKVTVLEMQGAVSQQASGNLAGAIHPLVTADWNLRSQFYAKGLESTLRWLQPWWKNGNIRGAQNGLMQLAMSATMVKRLQAGLEVMPENFAIWQTPQQASEQMGTLTKYGGLYFPQGCWVQPKSVVENCLSHDYIDVKLHQTVEDVQLLNMGANPKNDQAWRVLTATSHYDASVVVVATGALDARLNAKLQLPVRPVKGQVSHFGKSEINSALKTTVTHEGYSVCGDFGQASQVVAISGATFEAPNMTNHLSFASQQHNKTLATKALPNWLQSGDSECLAGNVVFRPTTPDHLPIFGEVPDWGWMAASYLQKNPSHAEHFYPKQRYQQGLYVSNGHGARGLMSAFLAADDIVNSLTGGASLLPETLRHAVHPARFAIRQWRKGLPQKNHHDQ